MVEKILTAVRPARLGALGIVGLGLLVGGCAPMPLQQNLMNFNGKTIPFYLYSPVYTQIKPGAWFGSGGSVFTPDGPYLSEPAKN